MPERKDMIGATHEFHDPEYVEWWAENFKVTPERFSCFEHIGDLLAAEPIAPLRILELGCGPGYLAGYLLNRFNNIQYHGLDYSDAMLGVAGRKMKGFSGRVAFQQIDLLDTSWPDQAVGPWSAIVSTWALHDLDSKEAIISVYASAHEMLEKGGLLINADFIKPEGLKMPFEKGRFPVSEHLAALKEIGFQYVTCTSEFEIETENPASHNNYACMIGRRIGE